MLRALWLSGLRCAGFGLSDVRATWARDYVVDQQSQHASNDGPGTVELPLISPAAGDWRPDRSGLAWEMGVGWLTAPRDVDAWMAEFLPAWIRKSSGR